MVLYLGGCSGCCEEWFWDLGWFVRFELYFFCVWGGYWWGVWLVRGWSWKGYVGCCCWRCYFRSWNVVKVIWGNEIEIIGVEVVLFLVIYVDIMMDCC